MIKWMVLRVKERKLIEQMEKLEVSNRALDNYKRYVKGNSRETYRVSELKLKRNFILATDVDNNCKRYGNLKIFYKGDKIIDIYNSKTKDMRYEIDYKLKERLDYILGL